MKLYIMWAYIANFSDIAREIDVPCKLDDEQLKEHILTILRKEYAYNDKFKKKATFHCFAPDFYLRVEAKDVFQEKESQ